MADLLSAAAQQLIDTHREEQLAAEMLDALLIGAPAAAVATPQGFVSKAAAKATATKRPVYTADAMIDLMVEHPEYTHADFATHFGYRASWFAGVLVSNNFQAALDSRRGEINNPALTGTMNDMFQAMTVQALVVLQSRLDDPKASEDLIIKAIGAGVKALGMGTPGMLPPAPTQPATLKDLAASLSVPKAIPASEPRDWTIDAALQELPR